MIKMGAARVIVFALLSLFVFHNTGVNCQEGNCHCAVFSTNVSSGEPLMSRTPGFHVSCNDEGSSDCQRMCSALAQVAKEKAPQMLCETVKITLTDVKPSVFSRVCDEREWKYTGLTSSQPICCSGSQSQPCKQA